MLRRIGLWWDSAARTLELETSKRHTYLEAFGSACAARVLTLRDVQSIAGRITSRRNSSHNTTLIYQSYYSY